MDYINLESDIRLLRFKPLAKSFISFNMILIIDGDNCLLIDTGYDRHFHIIEQYLKDINKKISKVIVSHFHNDHIGGLKNLKGIPVIGSIYSKDTLEKYRKGESELFPTDVVINEKEFSFGRHHIKIINNPGHSKDGTIILINNKFIFVGDDVIRSDQGNAVIPFLADQDFQQQISAIEQIKLLAKGKVLIPSHGQYLSNNFDIFKDLNERLAYLNYFYKYPEHTYNHFVNRTMIQFEGTKWHHYNMKKIR